MHYSFYRDTTASFTIDSTKLLITTEHTFYQHIISTGIECLYYKLKGVDNQGNESNPSEELAVIIISVNEQRRIMSDDRLYQNYPNLFNPSTKIGYRLKERGFAKLYVYDIKGELVSTLVNQFQEAGYYKVDINPSVHERQIANRFEVPMGKT
jgi:hypothetical protein